MPIEKVYLPPEARIVKQDDGTEKTEIVTPWEIRATGKEVNELRGVFKESAPQMLHETQKEWASIGEETITLPNGKTDVVRADKLDRYRNKPGFCKARIRPGITVDGFGGMRARGQTRYKAIYKGSQVTVLEER
jgi:hypothetical protein